MMCACVSKIAFPVRKFRDVQKLWEDGNSGIKYEEEDEGIA
jgi:hypothetical protein